MSRQMVCICIKKTLKNYLEAESSRFYLDFWTPQMWSNNIVMLFVLTPHMKWDEMSTTE